MRIPALILTVMAATLLVIPALPMEGAAPPGKDQAEDSAMKVKKLRKERLTVLKDLTEQVAVLYQGARASVDELLEARLQLLHAELEATETEAQRVALYKDYVDVLRQYESIADNRLKAGRGTGAAILKVRARRLEAEIQMEQAKMKAAKPAK